MSEFVPSGYISIRDAVQRLGHDLFPADWTDEEHKARTGLMGEEEWLKIKDLPPARGGGATGSWATRGSISANPVPAPAPSTGDPSSPSYQAEYRAHKRYAAARGRLRDLLERGDLDAAILDPFTGTLHPAPISLWRRFNAAQMIDKGEAPIPGSPNSGRLFVKQFGEVSVPRKPIPPARIGEVIGVLKEKLATESLTRPQQAEFVRKNYPQYHVTERQLAVIFKALPVPTGRPGKSNKKV